MNVEEARVKCDEAYAAYQLIVAARKTRLEITNLLPPTFVDRMSASVANVYVKVVGLKPPEAERCCECSIECVYRLVKGSGDTTELLKYSDDLNNLTNELTAITAKAWGKNNYEPVTAAIKGAKDRLTKVKKDADDLANNLGIAADLLSGFGKFVSVLK